MLKAPIPKDPVVLSYLALRRGVGIVALGLPFALAIPWWVLHGHMIQSSISGYYYTGMRNLFVGSLCAIAMFSLCCKGYDRKDEIAGVFSSICAFGVAFFPIAPDSCTTEYQEHIGDAHYTFATLLFLTLAYFCLVLFKMTAHRKAVTPQKLQRNRVYTGCGYAILASILMIGIRKVFKLDYSIGVLDPTFCFESTALIAFGLAWLIKGETFLKDENPDLARTRTTDHNILAE